MNMKKVSNEELNFYWHYKATGIDTAIEHF